MLNKTRLSFAGHAQAASVSLSLMCKKPMATMMTVVVIAIALALPALFWVFSEGLNQLSDGWQRGGRISLYLKPDVTSDQAADLQKKIQAIKGVGVAHLKSPADGLAELSQQEGMHDIMQYLPENPLPAMIEVVPSREMSAPAQVDLLARQLEPLPEVAELKLDMAWINRLHILFGFFAHLSHALMFLLASAVVLIIGNTLRLSIQNRHEEIQVLKLIGASESYILRPFLYSGLWYGVLGGIVAVLLVNVFILSLGLAINQLASVYEMSYPSLGLSIRQILLLLMFASILALFGAALSVRRQLATIEPSE